MLVNDQCVCVEVEDQLEYLLLKPDCRILAAVRASERERDDPTRAHEV
jgi:hypothetical protein